MKKVWKKKKLLIPAFAALLLAGALFWYVNDYYHSEESVTECFKNTGNVTTTEFEDGLYLDGPGTESAVIFYPGAKVEYTAYLPLLHHLANQGLDCFLVKMPCNLAFLGQNKAKGIMASYDYGHWYLCGHSLGGAMAASYASGHLEELDGLALLAAYPTKSLKADHFAVVSLYGSEDGVLNHKKLEKGRTLMPSDYTEICIEGGNHAWFGNYGKQKGDKEASISKEEQQKQTADAILSMASAHSGQRKETAIMTYQQITQQRAKELIEKEKDIVILDVRTLEEYQTGHIIGSICLPNEEIKKEDPAELPDKAQTILVYCRSGNRSKQAAQKLADMGYEHILEFGGIMDWPYTDLVE